MASLGSLQGPGQPMAALLVKDTRNVRRQEKRSCPTQSRTAHPRPLAEGITVLSERTSPFLLPQGFGISWQKSQNGAVLSVYGGCLLRVQTVIVARIPSRYTVGVPLWGCGSSSSSCLCQTGGTSNGVRHR